MKNQNDLIYSAVAFVVLLIVGLVSFFTKPDRAAPPAPAIIDEKMPALPANDVVVADALPGSQGGGGGGIGGPIGGPGAPGGAGRPGAGTLGSRGGGPGNGPTGGK